MVPWYAKAQFLEWVDKEVYLEDLRNWNNDETGHKSIEEDDKMEQFFSKNERMLEGKNTV